MTFIRFKVALLCLSLLALSLLGCGDNSSSQWSVEIGPEGGTAMRTEGNLAGTGVVIPPGALDTTIAVTIDETSATKTSDATVIGPGAVFGPAGTEFSAAIELILTYDPSRMPSGSTTADFIVKRRDRDGRIINVAVTSVDETNTQVRATVNGFDSYWVAVIENGGLIEIADYFPLNQNDRYEYDNGVVLQINSSTTHPNIQPELVNYIQLSGANFVRDGLYYEESLGQLLNTGRFSEQATVYSPSYQEIEDGTLVMLPDTAKLGDEFNSNSTYVGYTPWTSLTSTYTGTSSLTVRILTEGRLDTPLGRFDDVLEVEITSSREDTTPATNEVVNVFWLARDFGPVQVDLPEQEGLGAVEGARVDGVTYVPE